MEGLNPFTASIKHRRTCCTTLWIGAALVMALLEPARATEDGPTITTSGFGTIGATRSDQPWRYQRFLRNKVTFERDTVFGLQVDAQLARQWSATVQAKLAPASNKDSAWAVEPAWAFLAWRPRNDWLLRAGKLRVPLFLRSEVLDVGQTYDEARLPAEIYSMPPTNDFSGLHVTRSLVFGDAELNVDVYAGTAKTYKRLSVRDPVPSTVPGQPALLGAGVTFREVRITPAGVVFTWRDDRRMLRAGLHRMGVKTNAGASFIDRPVWATLAPGVGYWQSSNLLPGPGVIDRTRFNEWLLTVAGEWCSPGGWRVAGDFGWVAQQHIETALDAWGGTATLYKSIGPFVPYVSVASIHSSDVSANWIRALESTTVPGVVPGSATLNGAMRLQADRNLVYRQSSLALGSSYAFGPSSKFKFEWLHSRLEMSALVDLPSGEPTEKRRSVNVLSASYSFVF
jgi:hypothetical protein